jgi:hypothetical protein
MRAQQALEICGVLPFRLGELSLKEAITFLDNAITFQRPCKQSDLKLLAKACGCHPLALVVAYLQLTHDDGETVTSVAERVSRDPATLKIEGVPAYDLMAVVGQRISGFKEEHPELARKWRSLACFKEEFDVDTAAALWATTSDEIKRTREDLSLLDTLGFIQRTRYGYRIHNLLRVLAETGETPMSEERDRPLDDKRGRGRTVAGGAGSIAIGGDVLNATISTNVMKTSDNYTRSDDAPVEFPSLADPVDLILRIACIGDEEIRFDARSKKGRQVGPFKKRIGKTPERFAAGLSEIQRRQNPADNFATSELLAFGLEIRDLIPKELLEGENARVWRYTATAIPARAIRV